MSKASDLLKQINSLPKGYISQKIINGKTYFYLQRKENSKVVSEYIPSYNLNDVRNKIALREELIKQLTLLTDSGKKLHLPTKNSRDLSGYLMMGDEIVGEFSNGQTIFVDQNKAPLLFRNNGTIEAFLKSRCLDSTRINSRLLKKILGISQSEEQHIVSLYVYGATITDNYWFKPKGSALRYKDITFYSDIYNELALDGELIVSPTTPKATPQLTLIGSYEKCWRKIGDDWWMYKKETSDELFSELLASKIAKLINIPTAIYEYDDGYIRTKNFADKYNFEPMSYLMGNNEKYDDVFNKLNKRDKSLAKQYLNLIYFDALVNNIDRHNENYGFLRDKETGEIISLAPNFDNNLSLIGFKNILNDDPGKDGFIKFFLKFVKKNSVVQEYYQKMRFAKLNKKDIEKCIDSIPIKKEKEAITNYIYNRYIFLMNNLKKSA